MSEAIDLQQFRERTRIETFPVKARPQTAVWEWAIVPAGGVLILLISAILDFQRAPSQMFKSEEIAVGNVSEVVTASGKVNPGVTSVVGSYAIGTVTKVLCDFNTVVKAGQICATVDARPYQSLVDQARANLDVANAQLKKDEANLRYTQINFDRNKKLSGPQVVSQDAVELSRSVTDQATAQAALSKAVVERTKAELSAAELNLDYTNIRAPIDGTVYSKNISEGQVITPNTQSIPLFLIADSKGTMQIDADVRQRDIAAIREGNLVKVSVDGIPGRTLDGRVTQIRRWPQVSQNDVTYDTVISVDKDDIGLTSGMATSLRIITQSESAVRRVPNSALIFNPYTVPMSHDEKSAGPHVWVIRGDQLSLVPVKVGLSDGSYTAVESNELLAGDHVLTGEQDPSLFVEAQRRLGEALDRFSEIVRDSGLLPTS